MRNSQTSKWFRWYHKSEQLILGFTGMILVVAVWQMASALGWINTFLVSSPSQILSSAIEQTTKGAIWADFQVTAVEFIIAFGISAVIGILCGLVMGWYRHIEYVADPFLWFFYSTPLIAFYPLFVMWLGLGFKTVVMMGFLMAVIPITINTFAGAKGTNPILIRAARSFGATNRQMLLKISLPSALPMIVTGCRIGVERSLIGVIVGEMFSSNSGLGFRISYYGSRLQTANLFVSLVLVVLFGLILTQLIRLVEARLQNWQPKS